MLLRFKGYGLFVPAIFVGCFALVELVSLVAAARPAGDGWGLGVSLLLAGVICWFFGHWLKRRGSLLEDLRKSRQVGPEDCLRSFYWIKMEWWGPIFAALGLLCLLAAGCASGPSKPRSDISRTAQKAIEGLHVGMSVQEAVAAMKPVCLDCGTVYLGGSGQRDIYFQVSPTRQMFVSTGPVWQDGTYGHENEITRISPLEPKTAWKRGRHYEMCGDEISPR